MLKRYSLGRPSMIVDAILNSVMERLKIEQSHVDKTKQILDMLSFTKKDGKDVIVVSIGENIKITITQ
jgi:hypothetical protein